MGKKLSESSPRERLRIVKQSDISELTPEMKADLRFLESQADEDIDLTDPDSPDLSDKPGWVRGKFYRPRKAPISIRIDVDVLEWFKKREVHYQTLMNQALRGYMESHSKS